MSQSMEIEELQKLADDQSEMDIVLTVGWIIFLSCYIPVHFLLKGHDRLRKKLERVLVELICSFFVASWTGVVKYHGPRPSIRPKQIFVANHMSMIDFIILEQMTAFAVIMQKHPGNVTLKHAISHHLPVRYHGALPTLEKEGAVKDFSSACCQMAMHAWRDFAELNANLA